MGFDSSVKLFFSSHSLDYVDKCWKGRAASPKGSARNLAFKFAMNSLTGKFGQRTHSTSSCIYSTEFHPSAKVKDSFDELISRVVDFEPLFSRDGHNSAIILEVENKKQNPPYPIYLSGQILAYARVIMSRIMREADCYRNVDRAIYYTDTDSLLMPSDCLPPLMTAGYIGDGLGQLKCDLNEKSSFPGEFAKIIRGVWAATKGPYSLLYVLPNEQMLPVMEKVRVKGIPHVGKPFKHYDPIQLQLEEPRARLFAKIQRWLEDPLRWELPMGVIAQRFYMVKRADGTHYFAKHMNFDIIVSLMQQQCELFAFYGGMKKCFRHVNGDFLLVKPDVTRRMACKSDWWSASSQKRIYLPGEDSVYSLSRPVGYNV